MQQESLKLKLRLTENGVYSLYNLSNPSHVRLQVLYLTQWKMVWFTRLSDSEFLSPILILLKMPEAFSVGDILLIKKVQVQSIGAQKTEESYPMADADLSHLFILEYQVVDHKSKFGLLYQPQDDKRELDYWNSLLLVKNLLIKADSMAESFFKEEEKRLNSLRDDCTLLRQRGNELYKKQNFPMAILHYELAKEKDNYDPRVWNNSSQAYLQCNQYENAGRDALIALKLDPFCVKAYFRAGKALENLNERKAAIDIIEAGLYICGSSNNLQTLLRSIKSEGKPDNNVSKCNGKASLLNDFFATKKAKTKDSPAKKTKKQDGKEAQIKIPNKKHNAQIGPILSFLEGARMLYETGKFQNALEIFGDISSKYNCSDHLSTAELQVLHYLICICKFKSGQGNMEDNINTFSEMAEMDFFPFPPALHYWLAKIYEILSQEEKMIHHATICGTILSKSSSYNLFWPGTNDPIPETSAEELKVWFNEGSWRPTPFARCRFNDCISTQGHSMARREIYPKDFDFRGYVEVSCEELCLICYHPGCWKTLKEKNEPGKRAVKDFLGHNCFTPDCSGKISVIRVYDENSKLRNETFKDKKEKKNAPAVVKPKKKKDKKKEKNVVSNQNYRSEDKKKQKTIEVEESDPESNAPEVVSESITEISHPMKIDSQKSQEYHTDVTKLQDSDFKVLKPNDEDEFLIPSSRKNKNKNKKKKAKTISHLPLNATEYLEDRSNHNVYLSRLRDLRLLRESQELDIPISSDRTSGMRYLPEYALDPEKPFYLPQHLQQNHDLLERFLQTKMVTVSSSDIDTSTITTLLEFMYDWLKEHNPMSVSDSRLGECISESFPPNAVTYVNKCGGIKSFLLQSFKFAVIDDIICVKDQVVAAQEQVVKNSIEKLRCSKYLLSDGYRAQKLSHLLDDTKSTSSSNSSFSAIPMALNNPSAVPSVQTSLHNPSEMTKSLKSYTEVAMGKITPKKDSKEVPPSQSKMYILGKTKPKNPEETPKKPLDSTPRKRKLKTMDIDAIEVLGAGEMSQLFSPVKQSKSNGNHLDSFNNNIYISGFMDKLPKSGLSQIASNEQVLTPTSSQSSSDSVQSLSAASIAKLSERIKEIETELGKKTAEVQRFKEEHDTLTAQNQELNDRFSQIKTKSTVEITALRKQLDEAQEQAKTAETNLEWWKSQKEGEYKKLVSDRARLQEELKNHITKNDGLQLCVDQFTSSKVQMEEELKQKSIQLAHQQDQMMALQESLKSTNERAREAEFKYLSMKKELIKSNLEKTKKRLTAEVNKMYELLQEASERSKPSRELIRCSISDWDETIHKIQNALQAVMDDGQRFMEYIRSGRPLSALPPGDLQIPSIPDLTVAHLLFISKDPILPVYVKEGTSSLNNISSLPSYLNSSHSKTSTNLSNSFANFAPSTNISSKIGGLASGGVSFSPGQLPIGPNSSNSELKCFNLTNGNNSSSLNSKTVPILASDLSSTKSTGTSPAPAVTGIDLSSFSSGMHANESSELLVGHIPWSFSVDQVKSLFSNFGQVLRVTFLDSDNNRNAKGAKVRKGSVVFRSKRERDLALRSVPLRCGNTTLSLQAKDPLLPAPVPKLINTERPSPFSDLGLTEPWDKSTPVNVPVSMGSLPSPAPLKQAAPVVPLPPPPPASSAYGLHDLLEASSRAPPPARTVSTPTTPTASKPKFQNLRTSGNNIGPIGTLPPKLVRPIPRPGTASLNVSGSSNPQSAPKVDDSINNSASYKRLIDECKARFGNEYSVTEIHKAIREVREHNKNSLSGLALEDIIERILVRLRATQGARAMAPVSKPSVAPWAQLTQGSDPVADWGGTIRSKDVGEDHCAICLELLGSMTSMPLPCRHSFHVACIKNWLNKKSDCPICRKFALNSDEFPSLSGK